MSKTKIQVKQVKINIGTTANTLVTEKVTLDIQYKKCLGFAVYEKSNASNHKYEIGLNDNAVSIQDKVIADHLLTDKSVNPNERFINQEFQAGGNEVNIALSPLVNTTAVIELYILFKLSN